MLCGRDAARPSTACSVMIYLPFHLCETHWAYLVEEAVVSVYNSIGSYSIGIKGPLKGTDNYEYFDSLILPLQNRSFMQYMASINEAPQSSLFDFDRYSLIEEVKSLCWA